MDRRPSQVSSHYEQGGDVYLTAFTAVCLYRGIAEEHDFARLTLPAVADLNPDEIIVATDPESRDNHRGLSLVRSLLAGKPYRTLEVPYDQSWRFHLAHVCDDAIRAASHDCVLVTNVDDLVNDSILECIKYLGTDNNALAGGQALSHPDSDGAAIRNHRISKLAATKVPTDNLTGTFWLYRPWYIDAVDRSDYMNVLDGSDSFIFQSVRKSKYKWQAVPTITHRLLSREHLEQPLQAFLHGIHFKVSVDCNFESVSHPDVKSWAFRIGVLYAAMRPDSRLAKLCKNRSRWEVDCHVRVRRMFPLSYESSLKAEVILA